MHIGRINTERWLWFAHRCGAESVDGTGFFRGDENQLKGLHRYLRRSQKKLDHKEVEVEYSRTFFQDWEHESNREK